MTHIDKLTANLRAMTHAQVINSDNYRTYGTFAEIGAGLETSRYFFQAGKASTTIAKAMSAYAKEASDDIYLEPEYLACLRPEVQVHADGRLTQIKSDSSLPYTGRLRLLKMLRAEYKHLIDRFANQAFAASIDDERRNAGDDTIDFPAFFVYANTVAVNNWGRDADRCHGWVGARVQLRKPHNRQLTWDSALDGSYVDLLAHVVMLEEAREEQAETLGVFGVQLLDAAIQYSEGRIENRDRLLAAMMGNIEPSRLRIDVVDLSEGTFPEVGLRVEEPYASPQLAFDMVNQRLTHSVLLSTARRAELVNARGKKLLEVLAKKQEFEHMFPTNSQRVPQRFLSGSDVLVHELPILPVGALDRAAMKHLVEFDWSLDENDKLNNIKHLFVCPIGAFKDRQHIKFSTLATDFLKATEDTTHSLLLTRFSDFGWLSEHISRLTYDGGRVHLCFTAERLRQLLALSSKAWGDQDKWIDLTDSDERHKMTIRRSKMKGTKIWSDSALDLLMRIAQRPSTRKRGELKELPSCILRVATSGQPQPLDSLDGALTNLLRFMTVANKVVLLPRPAT